MDHAAMHDGIFTCVDTPRAWNSDHFRDANEGEKDRM